ncbi:CAP domain-containing protein [Terrilactibacillus laevilacticus]|uniref:CAP domain-containing protein n=1 Tax=Terrilactibacillus laevilacticus TaxID=1380157 RepID=UPI00114639C1|nr:CAP domain-containing protein [Terrilactibacillus laevilacticus]
MNKKLLSIALTAGLILPGVAATHANAETKPVNYKVCTASEKVVKFEKVNIHELIKKYNLPELEKLIKEQQSKKPVNHPKETTTNHKQESNSNSTHKPADSNTKKPAQPTNTEKPAKQDNVSKPSTQAPAPSKQPASNSENKPAANQSNSALNAFENKVVELTNQQRAKQGLKPLQIDTKLSKMARDKSKDMKDKNYFDHQSPTYGSPFDMMKSYGISYSTAGENIAAGQKTPQDVVNAWMNSEGHRKNIMNSHFTHIGVGYVDGGAKGTYWTQEFIGK